MNGDNCRRLRLSKQSKEDIEDEWEQQASIKSQRCLNRVLQMVVDIKYNVHQIKSGKEGSKRSSSKSATSVYQKSNIPQVHDLSSQREESIKRVGRPKGKLPPILCGIGHSKQGRCDCPGSVTYIQCCAKCSGQSSQKVIVLAKRVATTKTVVSEAEAMTMVAPNHRHCYHHHPLCQTTNQLTKTVAHVQ